MADRLAHVPHLPVASLPDRHDKRRVSIVTAARQHPDLGRICFAALDHDATAEPIEIVFVRHTEDSRLVDARDGVARVHEARCKIAIVGEKQQPFRVVIEAADGIHVFLDAANQIDDRRTPLRIRSRCHVAARLVEQQVAMPLR